MSDEKFIFTGAIKGRILAMMAVGAVLLLLGIWLTSKGIGEAGHGHHEEVTSKKEVTKVEGKTEVEKTEKVEKKDAHEEGHHGKSVWVLRLLKNLWHNNVFFTGIAVIGLFFVAFNYVAWAGWSAALKRIPEAFGYFLPIAAILTIGVFAIANHDLFHWTHKGLFDPKSPEYDEVIAGKAGFLNPVFYWIRLVGYFVLWILVWWMIRGFSVKEDIEGGTKWYDKSVIWSAAFLVIFAVTSSTSAWDWVMSVDTHFFSTMFGWYVFASWFVTGLSVITLFVVFLKDAGYLKVINENHLHDLGKFVFAFSIFWTYIWFAQFLLIYYANIPEESIYWVERLQSDPYTPIFFMNLICNFLFPFLILMTREAKRQTMILKVVCFVVIFGHWSDFYIMLTPGIMKENGAFGFTTLLVELGMFMIYAGIFIFTVLWGLTKANLVPKHHPMMGESLHHHVY